MITVVFVNSDVFFLRGAVVVCFLRCIRMLEFLDKMKAFVMCARYSLKVKRHLPTKKLNYASLLSPMQGLCMMNYILWTIYRIYLLLKKEIFKAITSNDDANKSWSELISIYSISYTHDAQNAYFTLVHMLKSRKVWHVRRVTAQFHSLLSAVSYSRFSSVNVLR